MATSATATSRRPCRARRASAWQACSFWIFAAANMVKTGLKFAGGSDMGRVRKNNEDAWHVDAERGIFLVVDGIGGHNAGEKAAEMAVERVRARLERQTGTTEQRIREAITVANNEIFRAAKSNPDWQG